LYTPVSKVLLSNLIPGVKFPKEKTHAITGFDPNEILAICSSTYRLNDNQFIYKPFQDILSNNNFKIFKKIKIYDNRKFYVDYVIESLKKETEHFKSYNGILPVISIWNSYDGSIATQIKFGYHFKGNNLSRPKGCKNEISNKHSKCKKNSLFDIPVNYFERFLKFIKEIHKDILCFKKMANIKVAKGFIQKIAKKLKYNKEIMEKVRTYLEENFKNSPLNLFTVYLSFNHAIYNTNLKELPEFKCKKDKLLLSHIISEV
jgi:hypothetical protein